MGWTPGVSNVVCLFDLCLSSLQLASTGTTIFLLKMNSRLRARARALHARVETTLKNRRFQPWANGRRQREDGRGLGVPGGGAA